MAIKHKLEEILSTFKIEGEAFYCEPYGNGHINDTYLVKTKTENGENKYMLQGINTYVFKNPQGIMDNIEKVTNYLREKALGKRVLSLIYNEDGHTYYKDSDGSFWRMYNFIDNAICLDIVDSADDFYECAVAFGKFQRDLCNFPADTLYETIPDFHNTPKRFETFLKACENNLSGRADTAKEEIEFVKNRKDFCSVLIDAYKEGKLPLKVTHNDTKSNNVMLDEETHKAVCVIDLDTIMPGFSVTDFGDAVRFGASTAAEDEKDLSKVNFDLDFFEAYVKGFIKGCQGMLDKKEIELLPEGAKMMTLECGMRFLADYIDGDLYFKTHYPEHNLVRARTQFKLVSDMEENWDKMKQIIQKYI